MNASQSRRDFIRTTCASCLLGSVAASLTSCDSQEPDDGGNGGGGGSPITLDLTQGSGQAVANPGGFLFISSARVIVYNDDGIIRAFSSICPHERFDVNILSGESFVCSSGHGSTYTTTGQVITGPTPGPLTSLNVSQTGNIITITR